MNKKLVSWILSLIILATLAAPVLAQEESSTPFVFGSSNFSQKFSPFFYQSAFDGDIVDLVAPELLKNDRLGAVVFNGIDGETIPYNGKDYTYYGIADFTVNYDEASDKTTYTAKLREDIVFSDGELLTADDLIFSYYVYLDPAYDGSTTLRTYDIVGLKDYLTQTTSDVYAKYETIANDIKAAGIDHAWSESDAWTKEQQDAYWQLEKENWLAEVQKIVDYVYTNYPGYAEDTLGLTADEIGADEGLKVAFGMAMWGFGEAADGVFTTASGKTFELATAKPTIEDYYEETYLAYEGDADAFFSVEAADSGAKSITAAAKDTFISTEAANEPELAAGIPNISGIKKLDDYTVEVVTNGYEAPAIYQIFGVRAAPLHYYGDGNYDYENNNFGHPYGDLSGVKAKTTEPLGMGPYKFVKYENRVVYLEANPNYFLGEPKTKYVQFKESNDAEFVAGIATGTIDSANVNGSKSNFNDIASYNDNGEITGNVISTYLVDNRGYGYIGLNASTILVGEDPASAESKDLRKAIGTVLAVYRDVAYDSYYGEAASVIQYPISNTSWAAPQPTDPGYKNAFSTDVDGNPIYTDQMGSDERYEAAIAAAKGFLVAAGYTFDEATGLLTAAPEGAKLSYEVLIPGEGTGNHPSFQVLTDASNALATIGFELKINDLTDTSLLWEILDSGKQELWCAAWQSTVDPDMYQIYHSSSITGRGGAESNRYFVDDPELDQLIIDARQSDDQAYRKEIYKAALDIIVDWAVEVPAYQRQNSVVFSTERVDNATVTQDITTFYDWDYDIQNLQMIAQ